MEEHIPLKGHVDSEKNTERLYMRKNVKRIKYAKHVGLFKCLDGCNVPFKFNNGLTEHLTKTRNRSIRKEFFSCTDKLCCSAGDTFAFIVENVSEN